MPSAITKYSRPDSLEVPGSEPGTPIRRRDGFNGKTGAYTRRASTNDGTFGSRTITKTGSGIDTVIRVNPPQSRAERDAGIIDLHKNGVHQQDIADVYNCSQPTVSRVINKKK